MVAVEKEVEIEMAEVAAPVEDAQKEFENFVAKQDQEKSFTLDDFAALDKDELCCEMVEGEHLAAPGQEGMGTRTTTRLLHSKSNSKNTLARLAVYFLLLFLIYFVSYNSFSSPLLSTLLSCL